MIKFTLDLSNPETMDMVVRKTVDRRETRTTRLILQIALALWSLYVLYKWLSPYSPSVVYPLLLLLLLGIALSIKKQGHLHHFSVLQGKGRGQHGYHLSETDPIVGADGR